MLVLLLAGTCSLAGAQDARAPKADPVASPPASTELFTLKDTMGFVRFEGPMRSLAWAPDGVHLMERPARRGGKERWLDPTTLEPVEMPKSQDEPDGKANPDAAPIVAALNKAGDVTLNRRGADADAAVAITKDGATGARKRILSTSPAGGFVSFVQDGKLRILEQPTVSPSPVSLEIGEPWTVGEDGNEDLLYGMLDWVYQEEIYGRGNFRGHWWNPKRELVAFLRLDESPVRAFTVVDHVPKGALDTERAVIAETTNYPKAGDPNPIVTVGIADPLTRSVQWVDLGGFPKDLLVMRVDWTPSGDELLVTVQDRIQQWAELRRCDPATGATTRVVREESKTWVNRPGSPRFLEDGTMLWMSERSGYRHVEHRNLAGELLADVTSGEWEVGRIVRVDEAKKLLWFTGAKDGATNSNLYRVALDGSDLRRLTPGDGTHRASLNGDGSRVLDSVSSMTERSRMRLVDGESGEVIREIAAADAGPSSGKRVSPKVPLLIPARDGLELDGSVILPTAFDADAGNYPIYLSTYSGPDAPTVRNAWRHSAWDQFLAQRGVIVLQVNVRTASGRGQAFTGLCYKQLGVQELMDLEDAVAFTVEKYRGDASRVAISGWSYGGFMAAYALTHSKAFSLGFAGAGVHDWQLYDTIYTERYMSTPQLNPEGYTKSSVIRAAGDLHGHLVILHGTMDDNVHLQNSIQLVHALQEANKDSFELMVYPKSRHGIRGRALREHKRRLEWRVLRERFLL